MSLNYRLVRRPDMRKDAAEGSEAVLCTGPFLEEIEIRKVLQHGGSTQLRLRGGCETGHRRHPVRHGGTVGRRGCDPAGPPG